MEFGRASYFVLAALIDGPLHGYAIVGRASELSGGAVRLSTGTLYGVLERATDEELVVAGRPYVVGGRRRRDYTRPSSRCATGAFTMRCTPRLTEWCETEESYRSGLGRLGSGSPNDARADSA